MAAKGKETVAKAVGKRKTSVARVYMSAGNGQIVVNGKPFEQYFGRETLRMIVRQPLKALDSLEKYNILLNIYGGGPSGQAGAARHAISRALDKSLEGARSVIKPLGFLTRDARAVERKKYGRHKARKRPQFSKR